MRQNWIILDRDGTLIADKNYLHDPNEVELLPGVLEGLKLLGEAGYILTVVTNQSGIGRGYFKLSDAEQVHKRMEELLQAGGVRLQGIYLCPHRPEEFCHCRKPSGGLVVKAMGDIGLCLENIACVVGDKRCDLELGQSLGAPTVLVLTGYGKEERLKGAHADCYAEDMVGVAQWILCRERGESSE